MNPQKALVYFLGILFHSCTSSTDTEICLLFIEKFSQYIDHTENLHVHHFIREILKQPANSQFLPQLVKILGSFSRWYTANLDTLVDVLNFLERALSFDKSTADAAAKAFKEICNSCKSLMIGHLETFFNILTNLDQFNMSEEGQLELIKAVSAIINHLPGDPFEIAMRELCKSQFEKIFSQANPLKHIDQLAEIFSRIGSEGHNAVAASIFMECWPTLSQIMDSTQDDEIIIKIIECLRCGVKSYKSDLLPIMEEMITKALNLSNVKSCPDILRLFIEIVDCVDVRFSSDLMSLFEAATTMTLNVLQDEKEFNSSIVEKFYELATKVALKFPKELMVSPIIFLILELAINCCCVDMKDSTPLKFLSTLLTIDNRNLDSYQREIISMYGEQIIFTLLHSSIFLYSDSSKFNYISNIFEAMKNACQQAFRALISKTFYSLPNRSSNGNVAVSEKNSRDFVNEITR